MVAYVVLDGAENGFQHGEQMVDLDIGLGHRVVTGSDGLGADLAGQRT